MPKVYSEEEKQDIIRRLKEEANNLMLERGVKKTTVDELVKRVGIPKGTFYLFYQSKEMLLFDCSQDFHHEDPQLFSRLRSQLVDAIGFRRYIQYEMRRNKRRALNKLRKNMS